MKLYLSIRDNVKVANLAHPMESSMLKVFPARPVPSQPAQATISSENLSILPSGKRLLYFSTSIIYIDQCNHTQAKPKPVFRRKQPTLVDDK
ncbi:unnamed protein product [Hymenolepis diminuta]|uniref:Uncharacterized protein n=1 Tax=Hymenolepis diminuta TaxID=6216 RepID=A0A564YGG0_HYMDI|nr:unnamed protein product [Hymenolepis diminuta]